MLSKLKSSLMKRSVDKADEKFISPHFSCGIVSADELLRLAELIKETPGCKIRLSGNLIVGIEDAGARKSFRSKAGMPLSSVARFCVRPIKMCSGDYICDNNQREILPLGRELDKTFHGQETPFKLVISVSGCSRCCSEPKVSDIGIVAEKAGFRVYAGGTAGSDPRVGKFLAGRLSASETVKVVDSIVRIYKEHGRAPGRLGALMDDMGFDKFKEEALSSLGQKRQ